MLIRRYILFSLPFVICLCSWGFYAHKQINRLAIYSLPPQMLRFYKSNAPWISAHAVDPDKKRYIDTLEAGRHFLDVEDYAAVIDSIPRRYTDALNKYSRPVLNKNGTVPWQINLVYNNLVKAFAQRDSAQILKLSAHLGHYVADAHSPLHTTSNYNGQLTGQQGIHAFWESRIPELFSAQWQLYAGKPVYLPNALTAAWDIVINAHARVDSVLRIERVLSLQYPERLRYDFEYKNGILTRGYSYVYASAYNNALQGMVQRQMKSSIAMLQNYWYSAWLDAGQPILENMPAPAIKATAEETRLLKIPDTGSCTH